MEILEQPEMPLPEWVPTPLTDAELATIAEYLAECAAAGCQADVTALREKRHNILEAAREAYYQWQPPFGLPTPEQTAQWFVQAGECDRLTDLIRLLERAKRQSVTTRHQLKTPF